MVERRLGRGLDFFLSRGERPREGAGHEVVDIDVASLQPSSQQPRTEFDEAQITALAESIRANGILQPILVRKIGGKHEIVAGERRWRAAKSAGLERIPAIVREMNDQDAAIFALVENIQRSDLNPLEKARAFRQLVDAAGGSQEETARRVGLDRSTVANFIRLLELPEEVQGLVSRGTISMGHARALLGLRKHEDQVLVAQRIVRDRLSVRDVESLVQDAKGRRPAQASAKPKSAKERAAWLVEIEDTLSETLETPVALRYGRKRAVISIECRGREEFERVYRLLQSIEAK